MGASQSTSSDSGSGAQSVESKTSYYQLLGVERQATDDEIKKAYRRKALELHPDRNYGNVDSTTKLFAEVQSAYEVLSDPQERAWYDSHETAILRGDDAGQEEAHYEANIKITSADDIARIVRKFNSSVEFTDAPSGFFGFLGEQFEHLAKEEEAAAYYGDADVPDYPTFGHKDDEYDEVAKPFYSVWSSFATRKTFAWKDLYRLSEAPDRRYRRAMEKENARLREEGIREFNDAVRSLVAFVRKRDPRYIPNTQSEAERQKVLRDAAAAQATRARAANAANLEQAVPDWAQVVQKDELEGEIEDSSSEEEHFECVACRKVFKSENQWQSHESSKKHQKAVQALRKKMQKDNRHLNLDDELVSSGIATPASEGVEDDAGDLGDDAAHPGLKQEEHNDSVHEDMNDLSLEDTVDQSSASDVEAPTSKDSPHRNKMKSQDRTPSPSDPEAETEPDSDYASPEAIASRLDPTTSTPDLSVDVSTEPELESESVAPKLGKAAQKRLKKAAAAQIASSDDSDNKHKCAGCNAAFPSKTRLFQHIKDFGHAAPKTIADPGGGGGGGKKGKKRK